MSLRKQHESAAQKSFRTTINTAIDEVAIELRKISKKYILDQENAFKEIEKEEDNGVAGAEQMAGILFARYIAHIGVNMYTALAKDGIPVPSIEKQLEDQEEANTPAILPVRSPEGVIVSGAPMDGIIMDDPANPPVSVASIAMSMNAEGKMG